MLDPDRGRGKFLEAPVLALFLRKGLNHRNAGQGLLDVRLEAALDFAFQLCHGAQRFAGQEGRGRHQRRREHRDERQRRVHPRHEKNHGHNEQQRVQRSENQCINRLIHKPTIAGNPADNIPNRVVAMKSQRAALQPRKEVLAHFVHHTPACISPAPGHYCIQEAARGKQRQHPQDHHPKNRLRTRAKRECSQEPIDGRLRRHLAQHVVGQQLERPRLEGSQCRRGHR